MNNNHNTDYLNLLSEHKYFPLITLPTRITATSKTCTDHIFYNKINSAHIFSGTIVNDDTDHNPIFAIFQFNLKVKTNSERPLIRHFKQNKY